MRPTTFLLKLDQSAPYNIVIITNITVVIFRGGDYFTLTSSLGRKHSECKLKLELQNIDNFHY